MATYVALPVSVVIQMEMAIRPVVKILILIRQVIMTVMILMRTKGHPIHIGTKIQMVMAIPQQHPPPVLGVLLQVLTGIQRRRLSPMVKTVTNEMQISIQEKLRYVTR
jgi:hypothetical protein